MDTATFFEKFSLFAHAEGAAARFREVVLNLAFSGRLKGTDLSGWETHPIGDFFTEGLKSINAPESPNQTYELWSVPSFETGAPEIVTGAQVGSTKRELRDGTILLGKINPHLNRIWVVNRRTNHPMIASQEWINVTAGAQWDTGYLARLLSSPSFNRSVCATAQGMGSLTRANTKQVAQIVVHCPPLKEQQKLIAKVDELMALCNRLEAQLKERDVKQAALAKAALAKFTEDPTPENLQLLFHPSFSIEPDDLRKTIMMLGATGMLLRANGLSRTKENAPYPSHWESITLESITTRMDSGWSPECLDRPANETEWGVLKTTAVQSLSYLESQNKALPKSLEPRPEDEVQDGDLLFTRAGPNNRVGILCVAKPTRSKLMLSDKIIRLRLSTKALPEFVAIQLSAEPVAAEIHKLKSGMAETQVNISQSKLKKVMVSLPSIDEQREIVLRIKALTELIEELSGQLEASRATGEKLLEAMVAELKA